MQIWLAERLKSALSISVITKRGSFDDKDENPIIDNKPKVYFVPAVGTYFFWYKRRFVTLSRDRKDNSTHSLSQMVASDKGAFRTKESFTLRIFSRNKELAKQLIEECRELALPDDGKVEIRVAVYNYWVLRDRVKPRHVSSVILDGNKAEDLLADIVEFQNSQSWYESIGIPWRRAYLLKGSPGNGKTSIVKALASELKMNIYLLILSDPDMTDNRINDLLSKVPPRSILLLEDIDCAFNFRVRSNGKESGLTFAGLLNALDGVATPEGWIIFMTTNHPEKLDEALIRKGRADVHEEFANASKSQARRLFERFYPNHKYLSKDFEIMIEDHRYSMASLQHYLMTNRNDPFMAIRNIKDIDTIQMNRTIDEPLEQPQESLHLLETDASEEQ
jgi:chaperone BCS1